MVRPDPSEFNETWCLNAVSDVDSNGENHFTIHMIDSPLEHNIGFRCCASDPLDFDENSSPGQFFA